MEKILIVYFSLTGNTEAMANAIADGIRQNQGDVTVENVSATPDITAYDKVMFGCPASGAEELEESEFEPYFQSVEKDIAHKKIALFGSYSWASGEWMQTWEQRALGDQANIYKTLIVFDAPDDAAIKECNEFGAGFVKY